MKNKNRLTIELAFMLMIFATLGCGVTSQLFPTPTPVFTSTPTITPSPTTTPTQTPTITPTPLPNISMAKVFLHELPTGFEELPSDEFSGDPVPVGEGAWQPEEAFVFVNAKKFQMIIGMNFFVVDQMDRVGFDIAVNQPDMVLKEIVNGIGTENVRDEKILDDLQDVGDEQVAMTMVADMNGIPARVEIVLFRRDIIGGMILSMTMEGQTPNISLHDLGVLFDQNIQKTLKTIKPATE
jgi:hypothetical protein